jgi:hypothetical protein
MAARKSFALRIDSKTYEAMQRWAKDDLRSLNAQIEYVLRDALRKSGRLNGPEKYSSGRARQARPEN